MKTTINLTERDLEVINWLKEFTLKEQGVQLNTTQVIKKCLYNEKYALSEEWKNDKFKDPYPEDFEKVQLPFN